MAKYLTTGMTSLLRLLKEVQFSLDQLNPDDQKGMDSHWLNKAKNDLMTLIADGERKADERLKRELKGG